eukprot:TRINITY_DN1527_c0_g1_i1.p1 TRINITY_DN1527_c0_g1~~TRINITY_DN1527_c0_g1_i1.p1  ORF type:complete len:449 (-),score=126.42 TRINITY_DN1527_c0_g1_i1:21-1367(-)
MGNENSTEDVGSKEIKIEYPFKPKVNLITVMEDKEDIKKIFSVEYLDKRMQVIKKDENSFYSGASLNRHSVVSDEDEDFEIVKKILKEGTDDEKLDKALGSFYGMVIGDALGAPLEFSPLRYGSNELKGFQEEIWFKENYNRFGLKPGQWTDDASMGLCIAESLIHCEGFNGVDLRIRFLNWWELGYCNAFGFDNYEETQKKMLRKGSGNSVGLGGNISMSFEEFKINKTEFTIAGDQYTSGNGSVMRMCAVPIYYHDSLEKGLEVSYKQSKTTHKGDEAAECCQLMNHLIYHSLNNGTGTKSDLDNITSFEPKLYSVKCLRDSKQEETDDSNSKLDLKDRNWNWKDENFKFSPTRSQKQPGYIGSYCMDAVSMALHCIHSTNSFEEALLKVTNLRGDSDSVGSVCGQMAGAIYGFKSIPKEWVETVSKWDKGGLIALRAYKLFKRVI